MLRSRPGHQTSSPSITTLPESACSSPATILSSVDLPQPDAPTRLRNSPLATCSVILSRASTSPLRESNLFVTPHRDSLIIVAPQGRIPHCVRNDGSDVPNDGWMFG